VGVSEILGLDIRYTYITDITYLRQWVRSPDMLKWFPMGSEKEVEDALQCWIGFCRWSASLTATVNHVPCGIGTLFLMPYKKVAHQCLFKVIVDPHWQKKGIGSSLVKNLKHLARNYFHLEMIGSEVFEGNPLIRLLEKSGFEEIFRQERAVRDGQEYKARIFLEAKL
jgi:RimJ/RimL family protein N-acetyltransferase